MARALHHTASMKSRAFRSSLVALSFVLPLAVSAAANAQEVCGDVTCPANWKCETETEPCADIPSDNGDAAEACMPSTYSYCAPLPCTDDSQCDTGMICYSETHEECESAPPCAGNGDCPAFEETCSTVTESACVPRYVAPCEEDADCGSGFTCDYEEDCVCSSSGSSGSSGGSAGSSSSGGASGSGEKPAPDAGADPTPPADGADGGTSDEPDCICSKSTDRKTCSMKLVTCSVDEGCPSGWTCGDNPQRDCWASSDGTSGCNGPEKVCLPPWSDVFQHNRGSTSVGLGGEDAPKGTDDGSTTSASGGSSNAAPGSNAANDPSSASSEESGGCTIARSSHAFGATFGFAALALAGLFGARRRRSR